MEKKRKREEEVFSRIAQGFQQAKEELAARQVADQELDAKRERRRLAWQAWEMKELEKKREEEKNTAKEARAGERKKEKETIEEEDWEQWKKAEKAKVMAEYNAKVKQLRFDTLAEWEKRKEKELGRRILARDAIQETLIDSPTLH